MSSHTPGGGGGLYEGAPHETSTFFRLQVYERVGEFVISVGKKAHKEWQMHFMTVKKSRKRSAFVIYLYLKTVHLRQLKVLNQVCEKGANCQQKVYERGTYSVKNGLLKDNGLDLGAERPHIKPCCVASQPPPPPPPIPEVRHVWQLRVGIICWHVWGKLKNWNIELVIVIVVLLTLSVLKSDAKVIR